MSGSALPPAAELATFVTICAAGCGRSWRRELGASGRPRVLCGAKECASARRRHRRTDLVECDGCSGRFKRSALRRVFELVTIENPPRSTRRHATGRVALWLCSDCRKLERAEGLADAA